MFKGLKVAATRSRRPILSLAVNGNSFCHLQNLVEVPPISIVTFSSALSTGIVNPVEMPAETRIYLKFVKLTPNAFPPSKGSDKAAGFDLKR